MIDDHEGISNESAQPLPDQPASNVTPLFKFDFEALKNSVPPDLIEADRLRKERDAMISYIGTLSKAFECIASMSMAGANPHHVAAFSALQGLLTRNSIETFYANLKKLGIS